LKRKIFKKVRKKFKNLSPVKNTGLNIYNLIYELSKFMETDQSAVIFLIILNHKD